MSEKKKEHGFSGLLDLASEVSSTGEPIDQEPKVEVRPSSPKQQPHPPSKKASAGAEGKSTNPSLSVDTATSGKRNGNENGKWIIGIIGGIFVILLIINGGQHTENPSPTPQSSSEATIYSKTNSSPVSQNPRPNRRTGIQYIKPTAGTDNLLSVAEIRWCIREEIRIAAMRDIINNNSGIYKFNRIINDYNSRCVHYRYHQDSKTKAELEVAPYRNRIVSEAIDTAQQLGHIESPSHPSSTPSASAFGDGDNYYISDSRRGYNEIPKGEIVVRGKATFFAMTNIDHATALSTKHALNRSRHRGLTSWEICDQYCLQSLATSHSHQINRYGSHIWTSNSYTDGTALAVSTFDWATVYIREEYKKAVIYVAIN